MKPIPDISLGQIKKISVAVNQLHLSDDNFRSILSGFNNKYGKPCTSRKELNSAQAEILINDIFIKRLGWKEKRLYKDNKYGKYEGRDSKFASVAQLELIDSKWYNNPNVHEKNDTAMNHFISKVAKVDRIEFLLKKDVSKVIKAISCISSPLLGRGVGGEAVL